MLIESIYTLLSTNGALQAAMGTRADTGVYFNVAPTQVKLPYVVMTQLGGKQTESLDGANALGEAMWQFACYGASALTAHKVASIVKGILNGLYGSYPGGSPVVHTLIYGAWLDAERDFVPEDLHATEFADMLDFTFGFVDAG